MVAIVDLERGIPSKRESSARADYVPALCTHRPSLLQSARVQEKVGPVLPLRATGGPLRGRPFI